MHAKNTQQRSSLHILVHPPMQLPPLCRVLHVYTTAEPQTKKYNREVATVPQPIASTSIQTAARWPAMLYRKYPAAVHRHVELVCSITLCAQGCQAPVMTTGKHLDRILNWQVKKQKLRRGVTPPAKHAKSQSRSDHAARPWHVMPHACTAHQEANSAVGIPTALHPAAHCGNSDSQMHYSHRSMGCRLESELLHTACNAYAPCHVVPCSRCRLRASKCSTYLPAWQCKWAGKQVAAVHCRWHTTRPCNLHKPLCKIATIQATDKIATIQATGKIATCSSPYPGLQHAQPVQYSKCALYWLACMQFALRTL